MDSNEKTFEQLKAEAAIRWNAINAERRRLFENQAHEWSKMPDIVDWPDPKIGRSYDGVSCPNAHTMFYVERWVPCNGVRFKMNARCCECSFRGVYDFTQGQWTWQAP